MDTTSNDASPVWFGIDLGTTQSCIAYVDPVSGRPVVVPSAIGENTTPSVVFFEAPDTVMVGSAARNSAPLAPHLAAQLVKRDMGRQDVVAEYFGQSYTPEKLSALILRELARATREHTGMTVREVVITVPAYFGIAEREATRKAGSIAGLAVLDVLSEPVAAALHHQSLHDAEGARQLLVCDLGGGTFDTSVITIDGRDVNVVCTDGDRRLGGADWDERLARHLVAGFVEQHPRLDPTADDEFAQRVHVLAEQTKRDLSRVESRRVDLRFAGSAARLEVTRTELESLTADLLDRVVDITSRTVDVARRKGIARFDEVILVGGMTRMPAVGRLLRDRLGLDAQLHEPDMAVAKGAALYAQLIRVRREMAGSISRAPAERAAEHLGLSVERVEELANQRVATTIPRAFGVKAVDTRDPLARTDPLSARQMVVHLLHANTTLPADSGPYPFATGIRNQRMAEIEVWEQNGTEESDEPADNTRIGTGLLTGIPARPAGFPIDITFAMSETGTLAVHAIEPESGAQIRFELQIGGMDSKDVEAARASIAEHEVRG